MKPRKHLLLLVALGIVLVSSFSCSKQSTPETAEPKTTDSDVKTSKPDPETARAMPVSARVVSSTLKQRLVGDNLLELSGEDWSENKWLNERIGRFYKYDDEIVQMVVAEVTNEILANSNRKMTGVSERRLRKRVNNQTYCQVAVNEILEASFDSEPLREIP